MFHVLMQTLLGLALTGAGVYLVFAFLQGLADGPDIWNMIFAAPLLIIGIILLLRAGKSDAMVVKKTKIPDLVQSQNEEQGSGFAHQLESNNKMMKEWEEINSSRDKLHMLQLGADAENEK